jgi:hypothetical protein
VTVEGLASLVVAAGVEKADQRLDGVGLLEVTSELTFVSCNTRGTGEATNSNGMLSSPLSVQGSPLYGVRKFSTDSWYHIR